MKARVIQSSKYSNEKLVEKLFTQETNVIAKSDATLNVLFNASKHIPGVYKAVAHVTYDQETKNLEGSFRIGTLNVKIINYTKNHKNKYHQTQCRSYRF